MSATGPSVQTGGTIRSKPWYTSKTIWANVAWPLLLWLLQQLSGGHLPIDPKIAATIQSVANIILRLVTALPIK